MLKLGDTVRIERALILQNWSIPNERHAQDERNYINCFVGRTGYVSFIDKDPAYPVMVELPALHDKTRTSLVRFAKSELYFLE